MGRCRTTSQSKSKRDRIALAKALAPEEIRRGDFVTLLYVINEWPTWYWDDDLQSRQEPVQVRMTPQDEPRPLKVLAVCLPFVLVKPPRGREQTLDVRTCRLARLDRRFAKAARRAYRKQAKPKCSAG
jgi:hypothetical protein